MQIQAISGFQLAPQQKRLWYLQQNSSAFCSQASILIEGNLQPEILQKAIVQVVNQHEILRTDFSRLPEVKTPVMVVRDRISDNFEYLDICDYSQKNISSKIPELFWQERQKYQNLSPGSFLRLYLIKLSDIQHILIVSLPALCADTRTIKNLVNQISQAYEQYCHGKAFSREYVQYVQFSEWQNQLLADEDAEVAKEYWQQQTISSLSALKLPHERQGKYEQFVINSYQLVINQELSDKIFNFAQKYEQTPDIVLLACWQTLIWRLTGQPDIVIGMASDRREYEELHDTLGLLATWLPIKTKFTSNLNFLEVLAAVVETLENAAEWQDYFVPEAREEDNFLAFPIGFEFENISENKFDCTELSFALQEIYSFIEPCKVKLTCLQRNNSLITEFYYDINYFSQETILRLGKNFQTLLRNLINNSKTPISQLEIISASERQQLLVDFNQTKTNYQSQKCIHQLFEEQVDKTPDQIAVVFENEELTYQELNFQANQLAHYLQKLGIKPEVVVGICVERSPKFIISLLAVLKAGGAYLPLDPNLPDEALQFRLQDAQASILIREQENAENFINITEVNLNTDWETISQESTENPINNVTPENLVYVIYTSGSTGKPKGVAVEHQQLLNYLYGILPKLQLPANSSYATVSTFAADLGNTIIFPSLCSGGCLHIVSWQRASDPAALAAYFRRHPIDCLKIVPSHLTALLSSECREILPRQLLILGGEAADWNLIEKIEKNAPHCRILNHYGPTETTIGVLTYSVNGKIQETVTVPIGKPIANTQVYVLDAHLQPVPLGVVGELYIGGDSLARGYLNHLELTNERFINNPFSDIQQRLYKTGDRVRYLSNGDIEFIGRLDDQVKVRGYRIELGEISTALSQHPEVRESAVIAKEDISGEKRLVAYIVPTSHSAFEHDFRNFLKAKLPEYTIPTSFVILKALPRSANGKLDRNALPAPEEVVSRETTFIAPRTPVEEVLASIWAQLLSVTKVSIEDNFFDLGGHSLLATQVISRIRTTFNVEIPLAKLFEFATLGALAAQIETAIRGEQQAIATITPVPRDKNLPLSFAQQRLWFFDQFEPGSPSYNLPRAVRLQGKLNIDALSASLNEIIRRHEILRTSFVISDGQPIQVISASVNLQLPVVNLQHIPQEQREAELYCLAKEEAQIGFNLTQSPLLRTKLLQLDVEEYVILLTLHHIVSDGWSTDIFIREVAALYTAFSVGRPSSLPQLSIQYADFAVWQRQWLEGEALKNQLAYWQKQLSGELPILQLPTDRPRPTVQTYAGKTLSFILPTSLSEGLKTLSKQEGVTLFMTLLAAFKTLIYRYTNQTDILVGSPIANRNRAEIENLIGFFVNTLVLRSNLSGNPSFRELLKQVREVSLGAYAHQDLPFEKLVEEIQPERNISHNPLFQVMFVLQNVPRTALELPDLNLEVLNVNSESASFDLCLTMEDSEQGLKGNLEYNTDLFDVARMNRLVGHFQTLLEGIIANAEQYLSDLPLLTSNEQCQLLEWGQNQTLGEHQHLQQCLCIHQLFEAQVERTPNAIALTFADTQLTYQQLNQRANQVAHHLQKLGVGPEVLVGLYVERSLEMVVGLLAVLKAGGAYVPLDPAYPQERIAFMLADAEVAIALTQQRLVADLPANSAQIICLDNLITQESTENLSTEVRPENLAYVIYTSGSTGRSKGVMIQHHSLTNAYLAWEEAYQLRTTASSHLQMASFSFDVFTGDLVRALCSGGKLVLCPRDLLLEPEKLYELILREKIDCAEFVPVVLRNLILYLEQNQKCLDFMRLIICGSDSWYGQEYEKFRQWIGRSTRLINSFGLTETTIDSTYFETQTINSSVEQLVPIGLPFSNTEIYILDNYFQPAPVGIIGEIYIGGAGVARGYLHRPDLTAEKFIPNLFSSKAGAILYKTGDLAKYLPDGQIELVGRIDNQVKIRGFRIELGEIESVLNQHPYVQANVVIVREDVPKQQRIIAYIVLNTEYPNLKTSELQGFLQQRLPSYMVPSAFVLLDELPLTPNGKIDRKALPAPTTNRIELEDTFAAPKNEIEKVLASIWSKLLGVECISIHDNFFELGGDSILIIQVVSQANQAGLHLTPKQLFQRQTIAELATVVSLTTSTLAEQGLITGSFPLTPIQHWFFEQNFVDPHHYNQSVLLKVKETINPLLLQQVVQSLLEHHDILRVCWQKLESGCQPIINNVENRELVTQIDFSTLPSNELDCAIASTIEQIQASLNLSEGLLFRVALFNLGKHNHSYLFVTIHHLIIDGVSWRILLEDLQAAYYQIAQGKAIKLPSKTTSFKQWAYRIQEYAQSPDAIAELDYWLTTLRQAMSTTGYTYANLPIDYAGGENTVASASTIAVHLSQKETLALLQEVPSVYRTKINDVLLTSLLLTFNQWTGQNTLLFDLEGHGREELFEDIDLSRTVGWFTSVFPVVLNWQETADLGATLKTIKEQLRRVPNRGIGYGMLRYLSKAQGSSELFSSLPQAEISFNYLGQFDRVLPESSLFKLVLQPNSYNESQRNHRSYLIDIYGGVESGKLQFKWAYSQNLHKKSTIEVLAQGFISNLRSLIHHCQSPEVGGFTASDFPLAQLDQAQLDTLFEQVSF
ncbi:amino acid adenylation domain-containing protein [Nostoc sp.]|uniref:amino acid adenylation domain-containing protein n=1 Tax=Nostoc sp. TaxID=1180 RepID=UPI002FF470C1